MHFRTRSPLYETDRGTAESVFDYFKLAGRGYLGVIECEKQREEETMRKHGVLFSHSSIYSPRWRDEGFRNDIALNMLSLLQKFAGQMGNQMRLCSDLFENEIYRSSHSVKPMIEIVCETDRLGAVCDFPDKIETPAIGRKDNKPLEVSLADYEPMVGVYFGSTEIGIADITRAPSTILAKLSRYVAEGASFALRCGSTVLPLKHMPEIYLISDGRYMLKEFDLEFSYKDSVEGVVTKAVRRYLLLEHKATRDTLSDAEFRVWQSVCQLVDRKRIAENRLAQRPRRAIGQVIRERSGYHGVEWSSGLRLPLSQKARDSTRFLEFGEWFEADIIPDADGSISDLCNVDPRPDYREGTDEDIEKLFTTRRSA
jgi:hypothetical protein